MLFEDDAGNRKLGDRCVGEQVAFKDFKFAKDAVTGAIRLQMCVSNSSYFKFIFIIKGDL